MKKNEELYGQLWELNTIWATLNEEERQWASERVEIVRYNKNEIIHHDGDDSRNMWMLISGKVRIYKEGIGQRQQIIRLLKPYDLFGYRAVIAGEPYNSNASAFEPCIVYRMDAEQFRQLVRRNGLFCYHIMLAMAKDLAISEIQTVNLTQKQLRESYGYEEDGQTIAMQMPREDLANMSNMTTSNAIRTLSQFAQEGLISVDGRKVKLLDEAELARISRLG